MSQLPPPPASPLRYQTPPAFPGPQRPTAVTIIATFAIVLAALGLLGSLFAMLPMFLPHMQADPVTKAIYANKLILGWMLAATAVAWVLSLINLFAAIGALKLKPSARRTMIKVAIAQIGLAIVGLLVNCFVTFPVMFAAAGNDAGSMGALIGGVVGGILGAVVGMILPVVTLIFFRKPGIIAAFEAPIAPYAATT